MLTAISPTLTVSFMLLVASFQQPWDSIREVSAYSHLRIGV